MPRLARRSLVLPAAALLAVLALGACGSSGDDNADSPLVTEPTATASATESGTSSPSPTETAKVIDVTMKGSKVTPAPDKVKVDKGEKVVINITRDSDGEVHVHDYGVSKQAKAGVPVELAFTADKVGVFEVEAHDPDVLLLQLQVS